MKSKNSLSRNGHRFPACPFLLSTIIIILPILISIILLWPTYAVQITFNNDSIKLYPIEINSELYIDYTHSVTKTNIREVLVFQRDKTFLLVRIEYDSFGAGLPTDSYGSFVHKDGKYINDGIDKRLDEVPLRIGVIANHKLTFQDGKHVVFSDFIEPGKLVIIKPIKTARVKVLFMEKEE